MSFRRFMREEIKKADRRYMEEEGEQDFQTNIAPLLQSETRTFVAFAVSENNINLMLFFVLLWPSF